MPCTISPSASRSLACNIAPVGLCGEFTRIRRVFGGEGGGHFVPGNSVAFEVAADRHLHEHWRAAGQRDRRHIAVVGRLDHYHFVAKTHAAKDRGQNGLGGPGGDRDFGGVIVTIAAVPRIGGY